MASEDRLSKLTKSLRCHILSFLPTKDSVATSILSREWKELWTEVPTLDLRDCDWKHPLVHAGGACLSDAINRFLQWNVVPMDTFRIWSWNGEVNNQYAMETWITTAIRRGVKTLSLYMVLGNLISMPRSLFTSETLVELRLIEVDIGTAWPRRVSLPRLKKLILSMVYYKHDETLPQLLSGCPVLEYLKIKEILEDDPLHSLIISSATLKYLKFIQYSGMKEHDYRLEIDAPALVHLKISESLFEYISAQMLSSLTEADVSIYTVECDREIEDGAIYSRSVLDFVDKLCHVKHLKLSIDYDQFLDSAFSASTIKFGNLTELSLSYFIDWRLIIKFLENADNLQVLTIDLDFPNSSKNIEYDRRCWVEPQQMTTCLSRHLTTIMITQFGCVKHELYMLRYFLKNARMLKTFKIHFATEISGEKKSCEIQRISQFERGSEACEIFFD